MNFDEQLDQQHLFLVNRMCRGCGQEKNLLSERDGSAIINPMIIASIIDTTEI